MRFAALAIAIPALAFAAVEGVVINETTGKPQAGATVTLIRLGNAMDTAGSVRTDAEGKFRIEQDLQADAPHLLQAMHDNVTYNTMLSPGSASTGVQLKVYNSSANAPNAKVAQHMMLVESNGSELTINETIIFENTGNVTFNTPAGTLPVYIQPEASTPRVSIQAPQGMPIQRPAEKGKEPNTYVIKYPMRPGETRVDVSYSMPAGTKFSGRVLHGGGPVRLVAPTGVKLEGSALTELGNEPRTQAMVYELKGTAVAFTVQGTGSLREAAAASGGGAAAAAEEDNSPGIDQVKPRIYKRLEAVLAVSLMMLAIGFVLLYRSDKRA